VWVETLRLADGRVLAFDDVGDPDGFPVVYQPGWMFGRLGRHPDDTSAAQAGLRLVSLDRPGYGGSTPQAMRTMSGSVEDTEQLVDHVGIDRFALLGWSGGGMHALAAAHYLGERVTHVVTVATPAPFDQPGATKSAHWLAVLPYRLRHVPPLRRAWFALLASQVKDPSAYVDGLMRFFGPEDRAVFADPAFRPRLEQSYAEVWAQGPTGADSDHAIISQPDLELGDVDQHVDVYHGRSDTFVRPGAATQLASLLPDAGVHLIPGGHLCVFTEWTELLGAVAGRAHSSTS
jgi:pimeloyl-ACP methyl ester carboxylesterase